MSVGYGKGENIELFGERSNGATYLRTVGRTWRHGNSVGIYFIMFRFSRVSGSVP